MGQAINLLADWAALDPEKNKALEENVKVLARWLSDAQEAHAEISKCLGRSFMATFTNGRCTLPDDFVKFKEDCILLENNKRLNIIPYEVGVAMQITYPAYYAIHDGSLHVWGATNQNPTIPYIARPSELSAGSIKAADLDIPKEFHDTLIIYLDSMWARTKGDAQGALALKKLFKAECVDDAIDNQTNRVGVQTTRAVLLG